MNERPAPRTEKHAILGAVPITRPKLYEIVSERLEEMILAGDLKPGDLLPSERDVMAAFQIGRPAVREAFLALQNRGLIVTESGRRARVTAPSVTKVLQSLNSTVRMILNDEQGLRDVYEARIFIEKAMARNAALNITDDQIAELRRALSDNKAAIGNREGFIDSDVRLHRVIFTVSGNRVFSAVYNVLMTWLMYRWSRIERNETTETLAYAGHRKLVDAIVKRNPEAAEARMEDHLNSSWTIWSGSQKRSR